MRGLILILSGTYCLLVSQCTPAWTGADWKAGDVFAAEIIGLYQGYDNPGDFGEMITEDWSGLPIVPQPERPTILSTRTGTTREVNSGFNYKDMPVGRAVEVNQGGIPISVSPAVRVKTDNRSYRSGQTIHLSIRNGLEERIYAPLQGTSCSTVGLQRFEAGEWITEGSCTVTKTPFFSVIASKSEISGVLDSGMRNPAFTGLIVSEPVSPYVVEQDPRTLPPVQPWEPGDPIITVPEGGVTLPGGKSALGPGTYRIEFSFKVGSTSGPMHTVYSDEFIVTE